MRMTQLFDLLLLSLCLQLASAELIPQPLSSPRYLLAATSNADSTRAYFIGGFMYVSLLWVRASKVDPYSASSSASQPSPAIDVIEILNSSTISTFALALSGARGSMGAAVVDECVLVVAGGHRYLAPIFCDSRCGR